MGIGPGHLMYGMAVALNDSMGCSSSIDNPESQNNF